MVNLVLTLLILAGVGLIACPLSGFMPVPVIRTRYGSVHGSIVCVLIGLASLYGAVWGWYSTVQPSGNQIALLERVYFCKPIQAGRNVALEGECGRQARTILPGLHIESWIGFVNTITYKDMIDVPTGHYAVLNAKDGIKLDEGQVAARPWLIGRHTFVNDAGNSVTGDMLDAAFFLTDGMGRKGPQTTVLTPGRYPVNTYLYDVTQDVYEGKTDTAPGVLSKNFVLTKVDTGHVAVIKSAIDDKSVPAFFPQDPGKAVNCAETALEKNLGQIKAVLVSVGCRGVWIHPLPPGEYFINTLVYHVEDVETRLQNWVYEGGYTRRVIDLTVANDGTIKQDEHSEKVETPPGAAGDAIAIKVEGWIVYQG